MTNGVKVSRMRRSAALAQGPGQALGAPGPSENTNLSPNKVKANLQNKPWENNFIAKNGVQRTEMETNIHTE